MSHINDFLSLIDLKTMRVFCLEHGSKAKYTKGECFTEAGQVGKYVAFIKSGYFKYCVLPSKGEYAVTGFSTADECVMDFTQSFLYGRPSKTSIIAGCDTEVVQVRLRSLRDYLLAQKPDLIPQTTAVLLDEAYNRYLNLYIKTPTQRYLELTERYPDIFEFATLRDIASYLQVTPIYLSRIRKKLNPIKNN